MRCRWRRRAERPTRRRRPGATPPTGSALAAVPSGLLIAVTSHISTDVAAAPLLWVIPLALYLAHLRDRVPVAADPAASLDARGRAGGHHRPGHRAGVRRGRLHLPADRRQRRRLLRHRAGVSRRAGAAAARGAASHGVLHVDVDRRDDRRDRGRPDRAARLLLGRRVPDPDRRSRSCAGPASPWEGRSHTFFWLGLAALALARPRWSAR